MKYKDAVLDYISDKACEEISRTVIKDLRKMTEGMQSGDDTPLKNVWDEVCVQMQSEPSYMWDAYEDTILGMIGQEVHKLDKNIIGAIWLQTGEGEDWDDDNESSEEENIINKNYYPDFPFIQIEPKENFTKNIIPDSIEYDLENVTNYILKEYVLKEAGEFTNKRIEKYLEDGESL